MNGINGIKAEHVDFGSNSYFASAADPPYNPLHVQYNSPDRKRRWALTFQLRPTPRILFTGDQPEHREIVDALAFTGFPVIMVQVIESVVGHMIATRKEP